MPRFKDIKQMTCSNYRVNVEWDCLKSWLGRQSRSDKPRMDPPYQRGYVWTEEQKTSYVEYILKGGVSGKDIFWNCPGWMNDFRGPMEIVDGKQRLSAVLSFLDNEIKAFGHLIEEYEDDIWRCHPDFIFHVHNLEDKGSVIQWYLDMNTGGSVHTEKDLEPAYAMLRELG